MQELKKDPIWLQACDDARREFSYGDIIPRDWLTLHLGLEYPDKPMTIKEHDARVWDVLSKVEAFKETMLTEHKWYLITVRGVGYIICKPQHQTKSAMLKLNRDLRKSITQAMKALVHINESVLSLEDARENAESKAKLAALRTMHINQLETKP